MGRQGANKESDSSNRKGRPVAKIYTRTGDKGTTSLFGGRKVRKDNGRLEAYGSLDELNAVLGWFRSRTTHPDLAALTEGIQQHLFDLGAHLATPAGAGARSQLPVLRAEWVTEMEKAIDGLEAELEPIHAFILPGGTEESAILHVARAVCRRAERWVVRAGAKDRAALEDAGMAYLNRLSDLLFVMARVSVHRSGGTETTWSPE
jgi:cob(I)alamin adenosyltransferase